MTTEEARKKWCPKVIVIIGPNDPTWQNRAVTNRCEIVGNGLGDTCCIADECACWVWDMEKNTDSKTGKTYLQVSWQGHCGLAR